MMRVIILLFIFVCNLWTTSFAEGSISDVIDLYQKGDYKNCIIKGNETIKEDPTSVLSYYYLALSYSKLNNKEQALKNYNKVINLGSDRTLTNLAKSAKNKLQEKEKTKQVTGVGDMLIDPDEVKKKELSGEAIVQEKKQPQKEVQKEIKQVAQKQEKNEKKTDGQPSNDEIVNAIRVLQKAGLLQGGLGSIPQQPQAQPQQYQQPQGQYPQQVPNNNMYMDERTREMHAMMQMMNYNNNGYGNNNGMMNMMPFMQNGGKMSPEMVQMMMMQQMMPDFSNNNNNGR